MVRVVVSLQSLDLERALEEADLIELRADLIWGRVPDHDEFPWKYSDRVILTYRSKAHGGAVNTTSEDLEKLLSYRGSVAYVDVELEYLSEVGGEGVIGSWHDFQGTPSKGKLMNVVEKLSRAELIKVVTMARSLEDGYRVLSLYASEYRERLIAFAMGELGSFSRRASALLGAPLIYTYLDEPVAPGQIPLREGTLIRGLVQALRASKKTYQEFL